MVRNAKLTRAEVIAALEECLSFLAKGKRPARINNTMLVLREWELDSEHGVELATDLCTRLGIDIPLDENPLIEETGPTKSRRQRNFAEVVDYLMNLSVN